MVRNSCSGATPPMFYTIFAVVFVLSAALAQRENGTSSDPDVIMISDSFTEEMSPAFSSCFRSIEEGRSFQPDALLRTDNFGSPSCNALFRPSSMSAQSSRILIPSQDITKGTSTQFVATGSYPFNDTITYWTTRIIVAASAPSKNLETVQLNLTLAGYEDIRVVGATVRNTFVPINCDADSVDKSQSRGSRKVLQCSIIFSANTTSRVSFFIATNASRPVENQEKRWTLVSNVALQSDEITKSLLQKLPSDTGTPQKVTVRNEDAARFTVVAFSGIPDPENWGLFITRNPEFGRIVTTPQTNGNNTIFPLNTQFTFVPNEGIHVGGELMDSMSVQLINLPQLRTLPIGVKVEISMYRVADTPRITQNYTIDVPVGVFYRNESNQGNGWISDQLLANPNFRPSTLPWLTNATRTVQVQGQLEAKDRDTPLEKLVFKAFAGPDRVPFNNSVFVQNQTTRCDPSAALLNDTSTDEEVRNAWSAMSRTNTSLAGCGLMQMIVTPQGRFNIQLPNSFVLPSSISPEIAKQLPPLNITFYVMVIDPAVGPLYNGTGTITLKLMPFFEPSTLQENGTNVQTILAVVGGIIILLALLVGFVYIFRNQRTESRPPKAKETDVEAATAASEDGSSRIIEMRTLHSDDDDDDDDFFTSIPFPATPMLELSPEMPEYIDHLEGKEKWNPLYQGPASPDASDRTSSMQPHLAQRQNTNLDVQEVRQSKPVITTQNLERHLSQHASPQPLSE